MGAVRDELLGEKAGSKDGWLAARGGAAVRERNALLRGSPRCPRRSLETPDVESTGWSSSGSWSTSTGTSSG